MVILKAKERRKTQKRENADERGKKKENRYVKSKRRISEREAEKSELMNDEEKGKRKKTEQRIGERKSRKNKIKNGSWRYKQPPENRKPTTGKTKLNPAKKSAITSILTLVEVARNFGGEPVLSFAPFPSLFDTFVYEIQGVHQQEAISLS